MKVDERRTKLVGVTFDSRQENIARLSDGQRLYFTHDKNNLFDANAIEVFSDEDKTASLGHINRRMAQYIVQRIMSGYEHAMFCVRVTGEGKMSRGVNVRVVGRKQDG